MNRLDQTLANITGIGLAILFIGGSVPLCSAQNPVHDANPARPAIETAVIEGVSPGLTTVEQLTQLWGEPRLEEVSGDEIVRLYSMEPLNHIEVTMRGGIVRSIVIELNPPFPEEDVRASLQSELAQSTPILIPDEQGKITGQIFPERGVLFLFSPQTAPQGFLVQRIAVEPVSADPFVLRAEAILYDRPTEAKRDLRDAVRIRSDNAKAHWLLAQIALWEGHVESALLYVGRAIQLDEQRPAYHLTFAQGLIQMNRIEEAKQYLQETLGICERFPHERARALLMLGELYRTSLNPDNELAYECIREATELATALFNHSNPTISLTAKDVLVEAHLATAKTVAWGNYKGKEEAIPKWIERAQALSRDPELSAARRYSREYPFKIAACALVTLADLPDVINIDFYAEEVIDAGNALINSTNDPILRAKHYWDTSISLYDAVQIFQLRQQFSSVLRYGEIAAQYMEIGLRGRNSDTDAYLLGRLYFRLGSIHSVANQNHRAAIEWYDMAKPIFERLRPKIDAGAWRTFGDMFVSMGTSYWATGQQEEAIRLTETGLRQLERGRQANMIDASVLHAPYSNLATMYQEIGDQENAAKYRRLAGPVGSTGHVIR